MSNRMELKKEQKRTLLLDAAEKLIAENGVRSMTMDQVANDADVAKGTLYVYFKNKESLCAAVNTRINKEFNKILKDDMEHFQSASEKIVSTGTATIGFSINNPQKWKAANELHNMAYKSKEDPNVKELLEEINKMIQLLTEVYKQGIKEGSIRKDLDPIPTAIYNRMALLNAFTPKSEQEMLLELNNITQERYRSVAWSLINRSTHKKPSLREGSEEPIENFNVAESSTEIKAIVNSMGLTTENALEIHDAWIQLTTILIGNPEYETIKTTKDQVIVHINKCNILENHEETGLPSVSMSEGCSKYCNNLVETLNPKYTQRFTKKICEGNSYCESIVELKSK